MGLTRTANLDLITLPNCGGLREDGKCSWLNVPTCTGAKCHYYHSPNSLAKAHERLRSLDEETQQRIAQKYYRGARPWMNANTKAGGE